MRKLITNAYRTIFVMLPTMVHGLYGILFKSIIVEDILGSVLRSLNISSKFRMEDTKIKLHNLIKLFSSVVYLIVFNKGSMCCVSIDQAIHFGM